MFPVRAVVLRPWNAVGSGSRTHEAVWRKAGRRLRLRRKPADSTSRNVQVANQKHHAGSRRAERSDELTQHARCDPLAVVEASIRIPMIELQRMATRWMGERMSRIAVRSLIRYAKSQRCMISDRKNGVLPPRVLLLQCISYRVVIKKAESA